MFGSIWGEKKIQLNLVYARWDWCQVSFTRVTKQVNLQLTRALFFLL